MVEKWEETAVFESEPDDAAAALVLARMMSDAGVDLDNEEAVRRWVEEFEALPEDERVARSATYVSGLAEQPLPSVRLAPESELAAAARGSALIEEARRLVDWADGRELVGGVLSRRDAAAAVGELKLETPRVAATQDDVPPELDRLLRTALASELLTVHGGRARPGAGLETLRNGADVAVLELWLTAFRAALNLDGHRQGGRTLFEVVEKELPAVLLHLYERQEPVARRQLHAGLLGFLRQTYGLPDPELWETVGQYALDLEAEDLTEWGVLHWYVDDDALGLTPLGVWGVRRLLIADGFTAPSE